MENKDANNNKLKEAYDAGRKIVYTDSENSEMNRAMELAFLWGLLGYPFDSEKAIKEGKM